MTKSTTMMSSFIMTLSLFMAPSSGGAFPFQRPAEIVGLPPFAMQAVYRYRVDKLVSCVITGCVLANVPVIQTIPDSVS